MVFRARVWILSMMLLAVAVSASARAISRPDEPQKATVRWKKPVIPVSFSSSLLKPNPAVRSGSDVLGALRRSLETWERAVDIKFQEVWSDRVSVSPAGVAGDGISLVTIAQTPENLVLFSGEEFDASARTRVFYSRSGTITEADIVLNPYQQFSTDGSFGTFDLEATITHEIGHLLGLVHSPVLGATMNEHQAKNGTFNLPGFSARTLSDDDIAAFRAIYGSHPTDGEGCCGSVSGKILAAGGKPAGKSLVWIEEEGTRRVLSGRYSDASGEFRFDGIVAGRHTVYAQGVDPRSGVDNPSSAEELGEVVVARGKTTLASFRASSAARLFDVSLFGINGQLSTIAMPLNSGKVFAVFMAGRNLHQGVYQVATGSPFLSVVPGSFARRGGEPGMQVVSFDVKVEADAPEGDYTLTLTDAGGAKKYIVGAVTVERFLNPWGIAGFD
jgi:hypothetical protein